MRDSHLRRGNTKSLLEGLDMVMPEKGPNREDKARGQAVRKRLPYVDGQPQVHVFGSEHSVPANDHDHHDQRCSPPSRPCTCTRSTPTPSSNTLISQTTSASRSADRQMRAPSPRRTTVTLILRFSVDSMRRFGRKAARYVSFIFVRSCRGLHPIS
jgi:hypothetical protein